MTDSRVGEYRPTLDKTGNWVARLPRLLIQWQSDDPVRHGEAFRSLTVMATDADGWVRTAAMLRLQHDRVVELEGGLGIEDLKAVMMRMEMRKDEVIRQLEVELARLKRGSDGGV